MSSIRSVRSFRPSRAAQTAYPFARCWPRTAETRKVIRLLAVTLGAASLAACAQSSVVTNRSASLSPSRQTAPEHHRTARSEPPQRVSVLRRHVPVVSAKDVGEGRVTSQGLASFYTEGTKTASGEKFDTHDLTAAHPTLPFGTRLRVTNVTNGQSVTVRVNDRGPYVQGRVVDVSYSAAEALGMVGRGVSKVKLDVVQ